MSDKSKIEWTEATWNPVVGCTRVSEGCRNCYAERMAARIANMSGAACGVGGRASEARGGYAAAVKWRGSLALPQWSGDVLTLPSMLDQPLRWRKPRRIFVCSMSDLFHERVPFEFITRVFDAMCTWRWPSKAAERTGDLEQLQDPGHTFQVLTKRPERIVPWLDWVFQSWPGDTPFQKAFDACGGKIPPHIWLGTSIEDQAAADTRICKLLKCPAAVHWLSCEPLLGPIMLQTPGPYQQHVGRSFLKPIMGMGGKRVISPGIDWVVVGGESGPGARLCDVDWIRGIARECAAAGVPYFVKQLGARPFTLNKGKPVIDWRKQIPRLAPGCRIRNRKGGDWSEWPEDLRVREWPRVARMVDDLIRGDT